MRKLVVIVAAAICGAMVATPAADAAYWTEDPNFYGFVNNSGVFYVAKRCFQRNGQDVGPGYIFSAAAITPNGWKTKTSDNLDVSLSDSRSGGWAKFGFHEARPYQTEPGIQENPYWKYWIKEVQIGLCKGRHMGQPSYGAGVRDSSYSPPFYSGGEIVFSVSAILNDGLADVARVTYRYRINDTYVRLWATVTQLCNWGVGCPANSKTIYVKEPKFTVSDWQSDQPHYFLGAVTTGGQNACEGPGWVSVIGDPNPTTRTLHCPAPTREQAWFKYDNLGTIADDCYAKCIWVVSRAATTDNPDTAARPLWYGQGYGLDAWAVRSSGRAAFGTPNEVVDVNFPHSASCSQYANDWTHWRRWEIGRWSPNGSGGTSNQIGFHGWEGGNGPTDCLNLFRQMGPLNETFTNYFEFWFR